MNLEFRIYQLKKNSKMFNKFSKDINDFTNEFLLISEEKLSDDYDCYKAQYLSSNGINAIRGLNIADTAYLIKKQDLILKEDDLPGYETCEIDIPKEYLTMEIIESIQKLNS